MDIWAGNFDPLGTCPLVLAQQPLFLSHRNDMFMAADAQDRCNFAAHPIDRPHGYTQLGGNFFERIPSVDQVQYFQFVLRQVLLRLLLSVGDHEFRDQRRGEALVPSDDVLVVLS